MTYVAFAYRMTDAQLESFRGHAPEWVTTDRYNIQARTEKQDVTKDEMRLMMRALPGDRFGLRMHREMRQSPVYGLERVRAGEPGAGLRLHPDGAGCAGVRPGLAADGLETGKGGFHSICGGILALPASVPGRIRIGGSKVSMQLVADSLTSWGRLGRPVLDKTGLTGGVDFVLEYVAQTGPEVDRADQVAGPSFQEALKKQFGLRQSAEKGGVEFLVLDAVARPTAN